jgi:hypothetical protein
LEETRETILEKAPQKLEASVERRRKEYLGAASEG